MGKNGNGSNKKKTSTGEFARDAALAKEQSRQLFAINHLHPLRNRGQDCPYISTFYLRRDAIPIGPYPETSPVVAAAIHLVETIRNPRDTESLFNAFNSYAKREGLPTFDARRQYDVTEVDSRYFQAALGRIGLTINNDISSRFTTTCVHGHPRSKVQIASDLTLQVFDPNRSLVDILREQEEEVEVIEGYFCSTCEERGDGKRSTSIQFLGATCTIILNRKSNVEVIVPLKFSHGSKWLKLKSFIYRFTGAAGGHFITITETINGWYQSFLQLF